MTQAFIILLTTDENKLDPRAGKHLEATIKELHRAGNANDSTCHIYQVKDPAKLAEWEQKLKQENFG